MTLTELEKLEALHAAATPGRWSPAVWQGNDDTGGWAAVGPHQESTDCVCEGEEARKDCKGYYCQDDRNQNDEEQAWEDAKAIAALHNAFPAMAKALREAQAAIKAHKSVSDSTCTSLTTAYQCAARERDEAQAEVKRLHEAAWKILSLAGAVCRWPDVADAVAVAQKIHKITEGMVE